MPIKGEVPGLERNIEAALQQNYDDYQTLLVADGSDDPAYEIARSVLPKYPLRNVRLLLSDAAGACSGKVAALLTAVGKSERDTEVFAFVDSDSFMPPGWLQELVDPLHDESIGATTAFRWYFPAEGNFWSHVEAAWNASGTNLLFDDRFNFPWGGAMAIRAETLERVQITQIWADAISDDMTLNLALRRHRYRIAFLPQCTVATFNHATLHSMTKWATRQTALTRTFNRGLWNYALAAYGFFDLVFMLGLVSLILGLVSDQIWFVPSILLLSPEFLGMIRSHQRCKAFERAMPYFKEEFERNRASQAMASLIVPWVMTCCIIKSAVTHEIEWRGRTYKLTGMTPIAPS